MIPRLVLDASVALAWIVPATAEQTRFAGEILGIIARDTPTLVVHSLWHVEIAQQLRAQRVAGRLSRVKQLNALGRLEALPTETHHPGLEVRHVLELSERYRVSGYDALYVYLAEREQIPLATLDSGMRMACERAGVEVITA